MERSADFIGVFNGYSTTVLRMLDAINSYTFPGQKFGDLGVVLEAAADEYFDHAARLRPLIGDVGQDAESAGVMVAMIGVDMMLMRQSALTALFVGETDEREGRGEVTIPLERAEQDAVEAGLDEFLAELLAEIGGTTLRRVAGASASGGPEPGNTVAKTVREILVTAGDDIEGFLKVGATSVLGAVVAAGAELWKAVPEADQVFQMRRLRWVASKAVEDARDKLAALWNTGGGQVIPALVTEFGDEVRQKFFTAGLAGALGQLLDEKQIVQECDAKLAAAGLTDQQVMKALLTMERTADDHRHWRRWFPKVTIGGRALAFLPVPGKRPWVVLATFVMVGLSVWGAAAFAGSGRLPAILKRRIRGVPDMVDDGLGLPQWLREALRKELIKARDAVEGRPGSTAKAKEAAATRRYGVTEEELLARISAFADVPAGTPADDLMASLRGKLDLDPEIARGLVVAQAVGQL